MPQEILFTAMQAEMRRISPAEGYESAYESILNEIQREVTEDA